MKHVHARRIRVRALLTAAAAAALGLPEAAPAAVTVTAVDPATFVTNTADLFDEARGATITATTPLRVGPVQAVIGRAAGDAFQSAIFSDTDGLNQSFTLRTAAPAAAVGGFNLFLADDSQTFPDSPDRTFTRVTLSGSLDGVTFTELGTTALGRYFQTYGSRLIRVSGTFAPAAYQFFRFDGVGSASVGLYGGRVVELDAVPAADLAGAVPEPAAWAMMLAGFGLAGGAMRVRRRSARVAAA